MAIHDEEAEEFMKFSDIIFGAMEGYNCSNANEKYIENNQCFNQGEN